MNGKNIISMLSISAILILFNITTVKADGGLKFEPNHCSFIKYNEISDGQGIAARICTKTIKQNELKDVDQTKIDSDPIYRLAFALMKATGKSAKAVVNILERMKKGIDKNKLTFFLIISPENFNEPDINHIEKINNELQVTISYKKLMEKKSRRGRLQPQALKQKRVFLFIITITEGNVEGITQVRFVDETGKDAWEDGAEIYTDDLVVRSCNPCPLTCDTPHSEGE